MLVQARKRKECTATKRLNVRLSLEIMKLYGQEYIMSVTMPPFSRWLLILYNSSIKHTFLHPYRRLVTHTHTRLKPTTTPRAHVSSDCQAITYSSQIYPNCNSEDLFLFVTTYTYYSTTSNHHLSSHNKHKNATIKTYVRCCTGATTHNLDSAERLNGL